AGPRRARWPRHRHAAFRRIGIPALERLASGARRAGRASRERSAGAPARAVPPARDLRRPDRDRARARAPRRAGAARPGRRRDRGLEECAARLDLARPAHAARGDFRGVVEPGGARRAPRRRRAQGAGGEHLRAIAADGRSDRQRARDDASRGGRDRAQPRLAQHERNCRLDAAPTAGPPGVAPGRGRPADGAAAGARRRRRRVPLYPDGRAGPAGPARSMTETRGTILVVEDEPEIRRFLRTSLATVGYRVVEDDTGARGAIDAGSHKPDLAIVDLGLPDIDGVQVIRRIRAWSPMPILVLSARAQERPKIEALDAGADDYVTKPFGVGELLARVRVALRHATRHGSGKSALKLGKVSADLEKHVVKRDGVEVHLTALEFR